MATGECGKKLEDYEMSQIKDVKHDVALNMNQAEEKEEIETESKSNLFERYRWLKISKDILFIGLRIIGVLLCLFVFIIALDLMSTGFRISLGLQVGQLFRSESIVTNPVASLVIGILVTVMVQSSSASTSIVVSLVGGKVIPLKNAIPIIMGANIGTSVTSTLVALTEVKFKENFNRAFAAGTVHDAFNFLSVLILLPLEMASGYLERFSGVFVFSIGNGTNTGGQNIDFIDVIKKPIVNGIIQIDKSLLDKYSDPNYNITGKERFLKQNCKFNYPNLTEYTAPCKYILKSDLFSDWSESTIGIVLTITSLAVVILSLIGISKLLGSIFQGAIAKIVKKIVNAKPIGVWNHIIGYVAIIIGCVFTILLQSSSVFTSSLIPLVASGVVTIDRVFPLTLGSNIGTTITGIIAALASSSNFKQSIQIALCHTIFNITGIIIWYPIPYIRKAPIAIAQYLGNRSAEHRWFAIAYLIVLFIVIPGVMIGLAAISNVLLYVVFGILLVIIVFLVLLIILQQKRPNILCPVLRTWDFLPKFIHCIFCDKSENKPNERKSIKSKHTSKVAPENYTTDVDEI